MTQELLDRVHRELLDVLNSINQDKIHHDGDDFHELLNDVEKALAQPEQEPVAWIHNFIDGGISIGKRPADLKRHPDRWTALYKDPKPCPTCEALARTVMLDQTSHDTSPPQRKPLTFAGQSISEIRLANGLIARLVKDILIVEFD